MSSVWKQILGAFMSAAFVALLVWVRLINPRRALACPWRLERVELAGRDDGVDAEAAPGGVVYVDGPHGVFSIDRDEGPGFGLIAGGVVSPA